MSSMATTTTIMRNPRSPRHVLNDQLRLLRASDDTPVVFVVGRQSKPIQGVSPAQDSDYSMNENESLSDSTCEEQMHLAERELSSFIAAVTKLYGPEQARLSAADWLEESELMDSPSRSEARNWRAVTIAASARLAKRATTRTSSEE